MAEIYRKPFESVQAAITLFEQKVDPKYCSNSSNKEDKGRILTDLIDCSLQIDDVLKQIIISEYLHAELKQSKEAQNILSKATYSAKNELDLVKSENEQLKQVNYENKNHIFEITEGYEVDNLRRELEEKNAEIIELKCMLVETERRVTFAEEAKLAVESQLRRWRDQRRLRRAASDAVKEYCAAQNEAQKRHEKPLLSKLGCINLEVDAIPSPPKKNFSLHDGRKSKRTQLGKLLKIKL